jgi:2-polyprenyl-6-methoxyphenol hydroxylase-like FAD-dependent oxidoreductase
MGRGAGLIGQNEIFAILRAVGCERVSQVGVIAHERITLARDGTVIDRRGPPQMQISWDCLYRAFLELLPPQAYRTGRSVAHVGQTDELAFAILDSAERWEFDLIVGADGVGSIVRSAVTEGATESKFAGYVARRGLLAETDLPVDAATVLLDRFAFYPLQRSHTLGYVVAGPSGEMTPGARRYNWVWYRPVFISGLPQVLTDATGTVHPFSLPPGGVSPDARDKLVALAAELLPAQFAAAVSAEPRPFVQAIFDYETPAMARAKILLLGDAAFVVRPHTAMGVAKAAGDALALAKHLRDLPPNAALNAYQAERLDVGRGRGSSAIGARRAPGVTGRPAGSWHGGAGAADRRRCARRRGGCGRAQSP